MFWVKFHDLLAYYLIKFGFFRKRKIRKAPVSAPPMWAKCAIPVDAPVTPRYKSNNNNIPTRYFAFIGIGGINNIIFALGNKKANARRTPDIAPDAPTTADCPPKIMCNAKAPSPHSI